MKKRNLQVITLNGSVFLGTLATDKDATVIKDSLCLGAVANVTKPHLAQYIQAANLGTLNKDVTVTGQAMFSQQDLADDLNLEYDILLLKFDQAAKAAPAKLVNAEFTKLIGG